MSNTFNNTVRLRTLITAAGLAMGLLFSAAPHADVSQPVSRYQVGEVLVKGSALRDAFMAARVLHGSTDAHGFTDNTVLDEVTDAGTYGAFDSVVRLRGHNVQDHIYSFQDRNRYEGSNVLKTMGGFMSRPVHSGTGKILFRTGMDIGDVEVASPGLVDQNIGLFIRDQRSGNNNAAITLAQSTGHTLYSSGAAPSYHKSNIVFGAGSGTVTPADASQLEGVRDLNEAEVAVASRLRALVKASRPKHGGPIYIGPLAQDVIAAFKAEGLSADDYSVVNREGQGLGVRLDQLLAFISAQPVVEGSAPKYYWLVLMCFVALAAIVIVLLNGKIRKKGAKISRMEKEIAYIKDLIGKTA